MARQETMSNQIANQTTQLADLCAWKPNLEARSGQLQATVADLQQASPSGAAVATVCGSEAAQATGLQTFALRRDDPRASWP
jgi:hypothetical protein